MSETVKSADAPATDEPAHRYTAALAAEIYARSLREDRDAFSCRYPFVCPDRGSRSQRSGQTNGGAP